MRKSLPEQLVRRIECEFLEMPGLQLTGAQAQRLWGLDPETCTIVLDLLVARRFLVLGSDTRYRRVADGPVVSRAHDGSESAYTGKARET